MAGTETAGQFPRSPIAKLGHALHETAVGIGHAVQKHPLRSALTGLTILGLGAALNLQKVFGPSNVVDNAPYSDTLPPPPQSPSPDSGPAVSVIVPPVDSGPSTGPKTPDVIKIDKKANVEAAVQKGILEVKEGDFEKYFTPVTPVETAKLLKEKGDSGFLLNFDPTKSPNLIILTLDIPTPTGVVHLTGFKNVGTGSVVYSSEPGTATIRSGNSGEDLIYSLKVQNENRLTGASFQRKGSQPLIATDEEVSVNIGTPLASISGSEPLSRFSGAQLVTGFGVNVRQANQGSLDQLARAVDGGIAYIPQGK